MLKNPSLDSTCIPIELQSCGGRRSAAGRRLVGRRPSVVGRSVGGRRLAVGSRRSVIGGRSAVGG